MVNQNALIGNNRKSKLIDETFTDCKPPAPPQAPPAPAIPKKCKVKSFTVYRANKQFDLDSFMPQARHEGLLGNRLTFFDTTTTKPAPRLDYRGKYALQALSRSILQNIRKGDKPAFSISTCKLWRVPNSHTCVWRNGDSAGYMGLMNCKSVWVCPVCSARIGAERANLLISKAQSMRDKGYSPLMFTRTLRHEKGDDLDALIVALSKATKRFYDNRLVSGLMDILGFHHDKARSLELTHGIKSGFHPHHHDFLFLDTKQAKSNLKSKISALVAEITDAKVTLPSLRGARARDSRLSRIERLEGDLTFYRDILKDLGKQFKLGFLRGFFAEIWAKCVEKAGAYATELRGFTLSFDNSSLDKYLTKFAHEIAFNTKKRGRNGNLSVWQVLSLAGDKSLSMSERAYYADVWRAYAIGTKGMKQFVTNFGLDDLDLDDDTPQDSVVTPIPDVFFNAIKATHNRGYLLDLAVSGENIINYAYSVYAQYKAQTDGLADGRYKFDLGSFKGDYFVAWAKSIGIVKAGQLTHFEIVYYRPPQAPPAPRLDESPPAPVQMTIPITL